MLISSATHILNPRHPSTRRERESRPLKKPVPIHTSSHRIDTIPADHEVHHSRRYPTCLKTGFAHLAYVGRLGGDRPLVAFLDRTTMAVDSGLDLTSGR
jgi:hypothetical protein